MEGHRAWIALNLEHLRHNVAALQALLPPGCRLMPVVKANAYGHGAVPIAQALSRLGIRSFCVATAEEGAELRRHHIPGDILILGFTPVEELSLVRRYDLIQTVVDWDYARQLSRLGAPIRVHVAVDTGMHRLGERWENLERIWAIFSMEHLQVEGMFTHLCADDTDKPQDRAFTAAQARAFELVVRQLHERGIRPPKIHLLGSYGLLNYPFLGGDYARVGMALYGVLSTGEDTRRWGAQLRPVLSLHARLSTLRTLYPGEHAGYGLDFTAQRETRMAALTIGYADGLPRALGSGVGSVLIHGRRAPILGRICMDQTLVDVTEIPEARAGDTAVLLGASGQEVISACDVARQAGTIANEILSRLGPRLERQTVCEPVPQRAYVHICRIREVHISTNRFTIHNDVCTSVSLTCNYCYFRNSSFCISVYNLCTVTDNTIVFLCTSWQEPRYIFECYNRNIETVAETDETRSLVRSVNIKHTCQICRLIGNDTYRTSTQTSKTDYNILCKVRHNLKEIMIVDYRFDDVFDIIWHVRVVRNNCHQ